MQGLMQDTQLTTNWIFDRGGRSMSTHAYQITRGG